MHSLLNDEDLNQLALDEDESKILLLHSLKLT